MQNADEPSSNHYHSNTRHENVTEHEDEGRTLGHGPVRGRHNMVFTDPVAFRYLLDDACTRVVNRHAILEGFELYLVEQWACSRTHPTFIISTYTGQPQHRVAASVLSVPENDQEWSTRLNTYLSTVSTFHARRKDTPLGTIMVTNLSSFPSALTVIQIPDGDFREYREMFIVNENLKRLGCSGRAGLTLSPPTGATITKFTQLFHTHENIPISVAVVELVKLCQVALVMFDKLSPEYADGLLCDVTEKAINDWWAKIGTDFFSVEPSDGILGPTTVSAMLGLYFGARNRLNAYGAPAAKDAFDVRSMKRAIGYFQRANKLSGVTPRRLDLRTLQRLHSSTSKAAHNERWVVPRAVKSTVAEYGGKGGEMVIGMVGREKTGIAEIETLDMSVLAQKVQGDYGRWLWQGKSKKAPPLEIFGPLDAEEETRFSGDERNGAVVPLKKRDTGHESKASNVSMAEPLYTMPHLGSQSSLEMSDKDPTLRRTVLKNVTGRMNDARSGLGKFRDAVGISGLRGHHSRHSRDVQDDRPYFLTDRSRPGSQAGVPAKESSVAPKLEPAFSGASSSSKALNIAKGEENAGAQKSAASVQPKSPHEDRHVLRAGEPYIGQVQTRFKDSRTRFAEKIVNQPARQREIQARLERSQSLPATTTQRTELESAEVGASLARHPSTGDIESVWMAVHGANDEAFRNTNDQSTALAMAHEQQLALSTQRAQKDLRRMSDNTTPILNTKLHDLETLEARFRREYDGLSYAYAERIREYRALQEGASELLTEEEAYLTEAFKELEILGAKLEYEMGSLVSKVEDVEDGVADFERQLEDLESRLDTVGKVEVKQGRWPFRLLGL